MCSRPRHATWEAQYAPETVNTDGWAATAQCVPTLFFLITIPVLCFLHGDWKVGDSYREDARPPPNVGTCTPRPPAEEWQRLMNKLAGRWCGTQTGTA